MQLYKGQTRAKPHGPALLQPDEPRKQSNPHNNYIPMPRPGTATRRRQPRPPPTQDSSIEWVNQGMEEGREDVKDQVAPPGG